MNLTILKRLLVAQALGQRSVAAWLVRPKNTPARRGKPRTPAEQQHHPVPTSALLSIHTAAPVCVPATVTNDDCGSHSCIVHCLRCLRGSSILMRLCCNAAMHCCDAPAHTRSTPSHCRPPEMRASNMCCSSFLSLSKTHRSQTASIMQVAAPAPPLAAPHHPAMPQPQPVHAVPAAAASFVRDETTSERSAVGDQFSEQDLIRVRHHPGWRMHMITHPRS